LAGLEIADVGGRLVVVDHGVCAGVLSPVADCGGRESLCPTANELADAIECEKDEYEPGHTAANGWQCTWFPIAVWQLVGPLDSIGRGVPCDLVGYCPVVELRGA
jgi:hypothetical protein